MFGYITSCTHNKNYMHRVYCTCSLSSDISCQAVAPATAIDARLRWASTSIESIDSNFREVVSRWLGTSIDFQTEVLGSQVEFRWRPVQRFDPHPRNHLVSTQGGLTTREPPGNHPQNFQCSMESQVVPGWFLGPKCRVLMGCSWVVPGWFPGSFFFHGTVSYRSYQLPDIRIMSYTDMHRVSYVSNVSMHIVHMHDDELKLQHAGLQYSGVPVQYHQSAAQKNVWKVKIFLDIRTLMNVYCTSKNTSTHACTLADKSNNSLKQTVNLKCARAILRLLEQGCGKLTMNDKTGIPQTIHAQCHHGEYMIRVAIAKFTTSALDYHFLWNYDFRLQLTIERRSDTPCWLFYGY